MVTGEPTLDEVTAELAELIRRQPDTTSENTIENARTAVLRQALALALTGNLHDLPAADAYVANPSKYYADHPKDQP